MEEIIKDVGKIEAEVEHLKEDTESIEKLTIWYGNSIKDLYRRVIEIEDKFTLINNKIDLIEKEEILELEEIEEVKETEKVDEVKTEDDITIIDVESDIPIKTKVKMSVGGII